MFDNILFVAMLFATRVMLPIVITFVLGSLMERALNRSTNAAL